MNLLVTVWNMLNGDVDDTGCGCDRLYGVGGVCCCVYRDVIEENGEDDAKVQSRLPTILVAVDGAYRKKAKKPNPVHKHNMVRTTNVTVT